MEAKRAGPPVRPAPPRTLATSVLLVSARLKHQPAALTNLTLKNLLVGKGKARRNVAPCASANHQNLLIVPLGEPDLIGFTDMLCDVGRHTTARLSFHLPILF